VTIASGDSLPQGVDILFHLTLRNVHSASNLKRALHVQSRSYWAPANIGPYSQAISVPLRSSQVDALPRLVHIAGQIPLVPASMVLPPPSGRSSTSAIIAQTDGRKVTNFEFQAVLSLQHLFRIAKTMSVTYFTSCAAFFPRHTSESRPLPQQAKLAYQAWAAQHRRPSDEEEDEERDLWEERHHGGLQSRAVKTDGRPLPDWEHIEAEDGHVPYFFGAEVESLPRESAVEWYAGLGVVGGVVKVSCCPLQYGAQG
jgi:diphthine-ammonia ligase